MSTDTRRGGGPCEDAGGRWPATSQEEASEEARLPTPWPQTASLQKCEEMRFCLSSHSICDTPLGQSEQTSRRRQRQPTAVFLPGESQGRGSLVGCRLWGCRVGHDGSDLAAAAAAAGNQRTPVCGPCALCCSAVREHSRASLQ